MPGVFRTVEKEQALVAGSQVVGREGSIVSAGWQIFILDVVCFFLDLFFG